MIWIAIALLTGLAALSILIPLARATAPISHADASRAFFDAQMNELRQDLDRGLLSPNEFAAAEAEAARRLIAAHDQTASSAVPSVRRRRAAAVIAIILAPAFALGLYARLGHPALADRPLQARLDAPPGKIELVAAVAKIEKRLARVPGDGAGWQVIAPVYLRMQRYDDAVKAWQNAVRILGSDAYRLGSLGEALVFAAKGKVTDQALAAFAEALKLDPAHNQSLFFTGLAAEQAGVPERAREYWTRLISSAPKDAPWVASLRQRIVDLDKTVKGGGPDSEAGKAIAALPSNEQTAAIRGMVAGLAAKLQEDGKNLDGWIMLIRAYTVLKQRDKASAAVKTARQNFADDAGALKKLNEQVRALGLGE